MLLERSGRMRPRTCRQKNLLILAGLGADSTSSSMPTVCTLAYRSRAERRAQESGVNANLLRKWITKYLLERERVLATAKPEVPANSVDVGRIPAVQETACDIVPSAFVPVVQVPALLPAPIVQPVSLAMELALHVRLPNGVEFDLGKARIDELTSVVKMLGRLPCSSSTKN